MKSILVLFALVLSPMSALAEGGSGLSGPADYYNPDYKCSIRDGLTVYINVMPTLSVSVTSYNSRSNKVYTDYLKAQYSCQYGDSYIYSLEQKIEDGSIGYLQISNYGINVLDLRGNLVSICVRLGHSVDEHGPYYP